MEKNKMSKPAIFMHSVIIVTCLASIICFTLYYGNIYKNTIEEILTNAELKIFNNHNKLSFNDECAK